MMTLIIKNVEVILQRKHHFKRNLGYPVDNCPRVSLICPSGSARRGLILIGYDFDEVPFSIKEGSNISAFQHHMRRYILKDL